MLVSKYEKFLKASKIVNKIVSLLLITPFVCLFTGNSKRFVDIGIRSDNDFSAKNFD